MDLGAAGAAAPLPALPGAAAAVGAGPEGGLSVPVLALLAAHPGLTPEAAGARWRAHRAVLQDRAAAPASAARAASSGCAAAGARRHADALADAARQALERWQRGDGARCDTCGTVLPLERLEAVPAAVRCTRCCAPAVIDTRWCR